MTKMFMSMNPLCPPLAREVHEKKHIKYDLRIEQLCKLPMTRTYGFGLESLSARECLLWNNMDDIIKNEPTRFAFKNKIKHYSGKGCTCRIWHLLAICSK